MPKPTSTVWQTLTTRLAPMGVAFALLAALWLGVRPVNAAAESTPPQFRWIPQLEELSPREFPHQLSRPLGRLPTALHRGETIPLPDGSWAVDFRRYSTPAEIETFTAQLESRYPELVQVTEIGRSWADRPILAMRITAAAVGDPDAKPALYVDGQHHAREAISAQVALYLAWYLVSHYGEEELVTHLLQTRTLYVVPSVNVDGNAIFLDQDRNQRKNANPTASDDDGDGLFDEDGREDAGYGTYDGFEYEFAADWVDAHAQDPFAPGWEAHLVSRRPLGIISRDGTVIPQIDNDQDGRLNEDGPGGTDLNRNYDLWWASGEADPRRDTYRGPAVWSEPESRAVRDFILARPTVALASTIHSGADVILYPWGWSTSATVPDLYRLHRMSQKGSQLTEKHGFQGSPHTWAARGLYAGSGSTMDWLYMQGILAWTPEVYAASILAFADRITTTNRYLVGLSAGDAFNPPPPQIPQSVHRWLDWHLYLMAATPNVGVSGVIAATGTMTVTVSNDGLLPLDVLAQVETQEAIYTRSFQGLSAVTHSWPVPLPVGPTTQTVTITLTAHSPIQIAARPPQVEMLQLEVTGSQLQLRRGNLEPFQDLALPFAGWQAGPEWDTPEYHLGWPLLFPEDLPLKQFLPVALHSQ